MQSALRWSAILLLAWVVPVGAALPADHVVSNLEREVEEAQADPVASADAVLRDPNAAVQDLVREKDHEGGDAPAPPPEDESGFTDAIRDAFEARLMVAGVAGLVITGLSLIGFAFVTRYVSPKEALKNPQRAMLYGFIRGNPGAHLKKLSEEFAMKTSSILWHIRKLESAELVHSERANGFRVFYPVDGGIEIKRVSRAITALQNRNARQLFEAVESRPGASPAELSDRLSIHPGTVRWHLRKLREFGLVEELMRDQGSQVFPTPLGVRSLQTMAGAPVEAPRPALFPIATPE